MSSRQLPGKTRPILPYNKTQLPALRPQRTLSEPVQQGYNSCGGLQILRGWTGIATRPALQGLQGPHNLSGSLLRCCLAVLCAQTLRGCGGLCKQHCEATTSGVTSIVSQQLGAIRQTATSQAASCSMDRGGNGGPPEVCDGKQARVAQAGQALPRQLPLLPQVNVVPPAGKGKLR